MTFDYTQAQLVVALPDLRLRTPLGGQIDGILPVLQRLDWADPESLKAFTKDSTTRGVLADALASAALALDEFREFFPGSHGQVLDREQHQPFPENSDAARRWISRQTRPSAADLDDLAARLEKHGLLGVLRQSGEQLDTWLERFADQAQSMRDSSFLTPIASTAFQVSWDDRGRVRLTAGSVANPYDRARLEAISAYTDGKPGLISCDVCARFFVPPRAGRPPRRCPGFECGDIAQQRYQLSPERREYRRLAARLRRAEASGEATAIAAAKQELDAFRASHSQESRS